MKTEKMTRIVSMVFLFLLAGEQALGVVPFPFYDGFENIDVGDYPDENGWQVMFSGVSALVSDDVAHTGTKSFRLDGTTWGRNDYVNVGPPEWTSNYMTYEISFYIPEGSAVGAWMGDNRYRLTALLVAATATASVVASDGVTVLDVRTVLCFGMALGVLVLALVPWGRMLRRRDAPATDPGTGKT